LVFSCFFLCVAFLGGAFVVCWGSFFFFVLGGGWGVCDH